MLVAFHAGFTYDAVGNLMATGSANYAYNGDEMMKSETTGTTVTYSHDGDGQRVQKSSGTIYWYGAGGQVLDETNLGGSLTNEYVFFGGKRIARRDSSGNIFYYFADHLGTSREIVQSGQVTACYDADFYPYGGEITPLNTCDDNLSIGAEGGVLLVGGGEVGTTKQGVAALKDALQEVKDSVTIPPPPPPPPPPKPPSI